MHRTFAISSPLARSVGVLRALRALDPAKKERVRAPGLEPGSNEWESLIVPLDHTRINP